MTILIEEQPTTPPANVRPSIGRPITASVSAASADVPGDTPAATAPHVHRELETEQFVLTVQHFNLFYGKTQALHDVSMNIPSGKVTALIGPSGCGKSTLLRSMNRLNDLVDGVRIDGSMTFKAEPIYGKNIDVIELRKRLGMVFQKSNPFPMSIFENVVYAMRIAGERRKSVLLETCEKSLRGAALWDEV